jgi:hypothetical protein
MAIILTCTSFYAGRFRPVEGFGTGFVMALHIDLKRAFRQATAVVLMGLAGAGAGGYVFHATHGRLDAHHTPDSIAAVQKYDTRLAAISALQKSLATTSDEDAASKLDKRKHVFLADVMLDSALSETDVGALAAKFNKLSGDDGVTFRFATDNPASVRERNECVNDVLLTSDRLETAERVQDCMLAYTQKDKEGGQTATEVGTLVGIALAGSFLLGGMFGRRKAQAPKS